MSENLLEIRNLNKKYPTFELKNVSFSVRPGTIMGFIGRNGAGKTTTLKSIMNMLHYDSGEVYIFNKEMTKNELEIKQNVAFSLSGVDFFPDKTIESIIDVTSRFYKNFSLEKFNKLCEHFGLDKKKKLCQLSNGMKMKFSLATALSHDAKLIIFDEPTSGLDPISRDELLEMFLNLVKKGDKSILFSTHITSDLDKCADEITYINNGEIKFTGNKREFINSYKVIKGPLNSLNENIKQICTSTKEHKDGFIGLVKSEDLSLINDKEINSSVPTLEEVMVFLERGKDYEEFNL